MRPALNLVRKLFNGLRKSPRAPRPGDAIRIMVDHIETHAGEIAVLEGKVRDLGPKDVAEICFNFSAYRDPDDKPEYVSASGGPAWKIAICDLKPTNETKRMLFWRFKHGEMRAGNGLRYMLTVPVWEYTPTEEGRQVVRDWILAGQKRSE
jgi:hypothetical protein